MLPFENYEDFCKAFSGDNLSKTRAELLLYLQDWIIRLSRDDDDSLPISELLALNADKSLMRAAKQDGLSKIVSECDSAARHIATNMRENIIRENVKLPVYQVKEVNSYGLNWLSRRPGRTIKEKISNSTSLMAVKRRMSLDAGENRLYVAFLRELNDILETKNKYRSKSQITEVEEEFWDFINSVLYNDELDEIGRWENMPPNNTLLSDQYYKKIWKGWEALRELDRFIEDSNLKISDRLCEIFYIEFLTRAGSVLRVPQVPAIVVYEDYEIEIESPVFYLVDKDNNKLFIQRGNESLYIEYREKAVDVTFSDSVVNISSASDGNNSLELSAGKISRVVDLLFVKLGIGIKGIAPKKKNEKTSFKAMTMDLFQLHPEYINDVGDIVSLSGRLALQNFGRYDLPCDDVNAIIVQSDKMVPYTIQSAVIDNSLPQLGQLMHLLEDQVVTNDFTFVFPDAFDEFQLSLVHKAARMAYRSVKSFPRSIGIAFDYQESPGFDGNFHRNDFLLIVDIVDDDVVFTMVQGLVSEDVRRDFPEYKGYVWERHPSSSYPIDSELNALYDELRPTGFSQYAEKLFEALGIDGVIDEKDKLSVIYDENFCFSFNARISEIVSRFRVNISDRVNKFLLDHREIIGTSKIHILSLSDNIVYKGNCRFEQIDRERALFGYKKYENLQKNLATLLWRDHLPELAIKLLCGKFMLVNKETITPRFNVKKKISIDSDFTLPANGKTEYRFHLVQSDSNKKTRFMAVVRSSAFPLSEDVPCTLDMTYEYGAENPYVLFFRPINRNNSKFVEAKVTWEKISEYPVDHLPYPEFMPEKTWTDLQSFSGRRGTEDLIYGSKGLINSLGNIQEGYSTLDLSDFAIKLKSGKNGRMFSIDTESGDGEQIRIIFDEHNVERNKENKPSVSFDRPGKISFDLASGNDVQRYRIDLYDFFPYGRIWKSLQYGHACFVHALIEDIDPDNRIEIAFYENNFDQPEDFDENISNISFELSVKPKKNKRGEDVYTALNIHDEDSSEEFRSAYWATSIRSGDKPGFYTYGGRIYFLMHTVFAGRKSVYDRDCPLELRQELENTIEAWNDIYYRCDDEYIKSRIFGLMSLVGSDIGAIYYAIARENIDRYLDDERRFKLNDYIGYGLGAYSLREEKELFEDILRLPDEKIICILSKAVWGNPDFIWNLPINITLKYFNYAIDRIGKLLDESKKKKVDKDITMCLEYILAVFRLREQYDESPGVMMQLSQNIKNVQRLYEYVEEIIDKVRDNIIEIKCLLDLRVTNKGLYETVPNLLYALLVYITGNTEAGDIRIAGLSMDDLEV